ncbi:hypothetical protein SAMN05660469_1052 [Fructobacillus pseudoficulneus]|nr:hypothetical protein SAMN05660469_1052 [Fructobacillus pseudoficulneus]
MDNLNKKLKAKMAFFLITFLLLKGSPNYWFIKPVIILNMLILAIICVKLYHYKKYKLNKNS